ncbi:hypothetical protein AAHB62_31250 [Bacillus cereus]
MTVILQVSITASPSFAAIDFPPNTNNVMIMDVFVPIEKAGD